MAKDLNKMQFTGRLGNDAEVKRLEGGNVVAKFSLASDDSYKDKSGTEVNRTEWTNVVAWGKLAEIAEKHFKKGTRLLVEGKKQTRTWEDKDKKINYTTELVLDNFVFIDSKKKESYTATETPAKTEVKTAVAAHAPTDDLPF